jgi:D-apionolactonase
VNGRLLKAGPLALTFQPDTGVLRHLRMGRFEVLRGIYGAVRDRNWGTVEPRLSVLQNETGPDRFSIVFKAECRAEGIAFDWTGTITGTPEGVISFAFEGEALAEFLRNRIGICVLHPIAECAGARCRVEHVDGRLSETTFPRFISPHQPFKEMRVIAHEVAPGLRAEVRFEGEVFEMEDQRNWTDASFKTYGTPLELPFPVRVTEGERIRQVVTVKLLGKMPRVSVADTPSALPVELNIDESATQPLPPLGLCVASHGQPLTEREVERLRALKLSHLRVDLRLASPDWPANFEQAVTEARAIGASLQTALHLTDDAECELERFVSEARRVRPPLSLVHVFHVNEKGTSARWIEVAHRHLGTAFPSLTLAAGADAYFAELNRHRGVGDTTALPCFSINPQVHAFDDLSLVETLAAQPATVESAWELFCRPVVISPVTLRPRFNPNATAAEPPPAPGELPSQVDARQPTLFAAAWTLGSLARLTTAPHVHSLTCFETTGWRGVMENDGGSQVPEKFPSVPGGVFPLYHVFADFAGFTRATPVRASDPLRVEAVLLTNEFGQRRLLVANLCDAPQEVSLHLEAREASSRQLTSDNVEHAMRDPEAFRAQPGERLALNNGWLAMRLTPHAVLCADLT